ncbi:Positive alginate biosynthesis regulatory protein [Rubrivivax sp. A210]|uniref:LytR/AlgR family response regulator transcription factor n=1 Tax=Rubrivivax sp. A210 TaxID=2772301 RepID=UPI001917F101|nr:LytTR family DNA-binding domain-containing protein [Rubrivivax sp. A210]CAD5372361.1 Positive alginate biosynthesis regulatory protein [Rubrivivax sp. A210]
MNILIVDDEELARLRLRTLVAGLPELNARVVGEAADADQALALLRAEAVDVVLLDIHMPGRDGLRLAAELRALPQRPAVIFVTAHAEHALQAFELAALDYLTKPVRRERLLAALQRVPRPIAAAASAAVPVVEAPVLVVSDRGRVLRLPLSELLLLRAEQKYVTLRTATQSHLLDDSLADLEQRLGDAVIRIHRSTLVARHAVRALELRSGGEDDGSGDGWAVRLAGVDEWLPVSRRQVAAVRAALEAAAAPPP